VLVVRLSAAIVLVLTACALAGCGASAKDQVRAKVQQFAAAAKQKDYRTICDEVLAPALVAHLTANHIPCVDAMRLALGSVRNPTLSIGPVTVRGKAASVYTLTVAQGQQASLDVLHLIETGDGWRITSLNAPLPR
jgi:outer membrane murein-binding lipoprotein Lpp